MTGRVLILGATGSFGGAMAYEYLARDHDVRALVRDMAKARARFGAINGLELISGDVKDVDAIRRVAKGCGIIVHGVNYPYHMWRPHMVEVTRNIVTVAREVGAAILFPGNVYGFGRQFGNPLDESYEMRPCSEKGRLRVELEKMLADEAGDGLQVVILRAGDYFGPTVRNGLVDRLFRPALAGKTMTMFGDPDKPHQWAYVPDLARAAADVMARRDELQDFEIMHFEGYVARPARAFPDAIAEVAGKPWLRVKSAPWPLLKLVGLFDPVVRELMELRYLWDESVLLSGGKLRRFLKDYRDTPLPQAISETLASYRGAPRTGPEGTGELSRSRDRVST